MIGRGHRVPAGATVGRILLVAMVLVALAPGFPGSPVWAQAGDGDGAVAAVPAPEVAALGASGDWLATVQASIYQDMGSTGETGAIQGLRPDLGWSPGGEAASDGFGLSVASAGDVNGDGLADVIVGAPYFGAGNKGKAYVYLGSETGLEDNWVWTQAGVNDGDLFGISVDGAGDVNGDGFDDIVVGAYQFESKGRVYVFLGSDSGVEQSPLPPFDAESAGDSFGYSVAGAGDVNGDGYADIVVGDRGYNDDSNSDAGRAYIYHGGSSGPDATPDRTLTGEASSDWFGYSVAGAGDVNGDGYADVIVGAIGYDVFPPTQAGAAYLFFGGEGGVSDTWDWRQTGGSYDDWYGSSVATAGDVNGDGYADIIVGAKYYGDESISGPDTGAAYVYYGGANGPRDAGWDWRVLGENDLDLYGASVASAGDVNGDGFADVLVGAPGFQGGTDYGKAYLYKGGASGLATDDVWSPQGGVDSEYGACVAGAGDVNGDGYADVVVGAPGHSSDAGKAYAYLGEADNPSKSDEWDWRAEGATAGDYFARVACAGDVNGDGYADVLIGAWLENGGQGRAYVYFGSDDGLPDFADWDDAGEQAGSWFGRSVAGAGDVNGDGYGDIIVGAWSYATSSDPGDDETGRAYLYYGQADGLSVDPVWFDTGEAAGDRFGIRVAGAGDVNGDGYADVIVGADGHNMWTGRAYVYYGSADGLGDSADRTLDGAAHYEYFGFSVAGAGDVDGDGYGDVVVGAYGAPGGEFVGQNRGTVYVFRGTSSGLEPNATWTFEGENDSDYFGYSVAGAGDVNADGYGDVVAGAYGFDGGRGKVYLYDFTASGPGSDAVWSASGISPGSWFGHSVAGAGDINGDGHADFLVGAYKADGGTDMGRAWAFFGPRPDNPTFGDWGGAGEANGDRYGYTVAGGDINGDGFSDILVGADQGLSVGGGKVYAYFANDGGGKLVLSRQMLQTSRQVPPWGLTDTPDGFQVRMWASDPAGRGRMKLEVEACPPGAAFGDTENCATAFSTQWLDLVPSTTGLALRALWVPITGLDGATLYRWRGRVLYAPYSVTEPGITPPPNPAHGPWRRFLAQAFEADLRTETCAYGLEVTPSSDAQSGAAGETVSYTLHLTNTGTCADTFDVAASGNSWTTTVASPVGPLAVDAGTDVPVTVDIPADATGGDSDQATITFTSQGDAAQSASSTLTTEVGGWMVYLPVVLRVH